MKKHFTYEQHKETGPKISAISEYLTDLFFQLMQAYPKNSTVCYRARKAVNAMDELRSALDDCVIREHPWKTDAEVLGVYYGDDACKEGQNTQKDPAAITQEDLRRAVAKLPTLTINGHGNPCSNENCKAFRRPLGDPNFYCIKTDCATFQQARAELLKRLDEFTASVRWLLGKSKRQTINPRHSSGNLKHVMEDETHEYAINGAFIAAALHCGFQCKTITNWPSVHFNISGKSLRRGRTQI